MLKWKLSLMVYVFTLLGSVSVLVDYLELRDVIDNQGNEIFYRASLERYKAHLQRNIDNPNRFNNEEGILKFYEDKYRGFENIDGILKKGFLDSMKVQIPSSEDPIISQFLVETEARLSELIEAQMLFSEFMSKKESYIKWSNTIKILLPFIVAFGFLTQAIILWFDRKRLEN